MGLRAGEGAPQVVTALLRSGWSLLASSLADGGGVARHLVEI